MISKAERYSHSHICIYDLHMNLNKYIVLYRFTSIVHNGEYDIYKPINIPSSYIYY